ncbi:MAG: hypothetical protein AVDCRST_MAG77-244 [uncultured Chloroflexi bacterium]|uniref:HTH luxR-type domain-containing protein n=1 Tax=uncultured Chloroflexota bacterium TaxID=166587 RepID=A0A6J4H8D4_9CHLR|nr:MAG: hypothetical protein AVDCRST_MAG77-244 [uncultured Chloroflexota bacterium]
MHLQQTRPTTPALAASRLQPRELFVLQLRARGYSREQLAALLAMTTPEMEDVEHSACAALGVATVEEAVELARRRCLIV